MDIKFFRVTFGADPEFFFKQEGRVIGAEKVIPKDGVRDEWGNKRIIIDGVQAEFNPEPSGCRQTLSSNLRQCFVELQNTIKGKTVEVDFGAAVEVTDGELSSLNKENQTFGCSPSKNAHRAAAIQVKDASKYNYRSAGGHIHLGVYNAASMILKENPEHVVRLLDVLLGNTCVLLDRDPGNVERRKNYGRAGEYRTPAHGLEYRTLSNFWLRSYALTSFVLGMARFAVNVARDEAASNAILALVDMDKVEEAINTNNFDLAMENFNAVKTLVSEMEDIEVGWSLPLEGDRLPAFEKLVKDGVEKYFPQEPLTAWVRESFTYGWERFANNKLS